MKRPDKELLKSCLTAYVVLASDGWTSRATETFLTVTAHYIILVTVNSYLFLAFVKDNFLCQINEKHVGTSNVYSCSASICLLLTSDCHNDVSNVRLPHFFSFNLTIQDIIDFHNEQRIPNQPKTVTTKP